MNALVMTNKIREEKKNPNELQHKIRSNISSCFGGLMILGLKKIGGKRKKVREGGVVFTYGRLGLDPGSLRDNTSKDKQESPMLFPHRNHLYA